MHSNEHFNYFRMKNEETDYKEVLNSTLLFAFVRVLQMVVGLIRNKLVAVILGPSGVGVIELYFKTTELVKKASGLGISQSSLRDISAAKAGDNLETYYKVLLVTKRVVFFTSLLGLLLTLILSPLLSQWTFGDKTRTVPYMFLSLLTFFAIRTEIQTSILKGVRAQKHLAISNMIGSIAGLVVSIPLYYIWGEEGIVPALIINAAVAFLSTNWFVNKIECKTVSVSWKETLSFATPMVKVGIILMSVGFLDSIVSVVLSSFLRSKGGLEVVGFYQAGYSIVGSYIGIIATSLVMDYYPRLSAVYNNNIKIHDELNKQVKIGLLFIFPLASLFVFFIPQIVTLLYTQEFSAVVLFVDFAIYGAVLQIIAECTKMILVAKQDAMLYLIVSFMVRIVILPTYMLLFIKYGLLGLGVAYFISFFLRTIVFGIIVYLKYRIVLDKSSFLLFLSTIVSVSFMLAVRTFELWYFKYPTAALIMLIVLYYTNFKYKEYLGVPLIDTVKSKMFDKNRINKLWKK